MKILAVIQARGGSKGIPKKNIYPLQGYPLISYTIAACAASKMVTELVVSTDSEEIAEVARSFGAKVPFMRPAELAGDKVPSVDSLHHAVRETERIFDVTYDYVVELPCVSPLRDGEDIDGVLTKLVETGCDSVITMCDTGEKHPIRLKKIIGDQIHDFCKEYPEPAIGSRRQDLKPESYIRNGAIYAMTRKVLIEEHSRHGADSRPYVMPIEHSVNIDEMMDLRVAGFLIGDGYCRNNPGQLKRRIVERVPKAGKKHLLVSTPIHFLPDVKSDLTERFECTFASGVTKDDLAELVQDADGWICNPCPEFTIDESILAGAKQLKVIATTSTGSNHIDKVYCKDQGIEVLSLRGTNLLDSIRASSEFTFNLLMSTIRKTPYAFASAKAGRWREVEDHLRGVELSGLNLGIIGYGRIGSNNARYANAFGMNVLSYDPNVRIEDSYVTQCSSYEEVIAKADAVMICVHLDESTRNMVDESWFQQMKNGVYFINTSRGEIVDEAALLKNLTSKHIKAAAVDVITDEFTSDKPTHPMIQYARENDNLIVTPHIAGLTYDSERKAAQITISGVLKFFEMD